MFFGEGPSAPGAGAGPGRGRCQQGGDRKAERDEMHGAMTSWDHQASDAQASGQQLVSMLPCDPLYRDGEKVNPGSPAPQQCTSLEIFCKGSPGHTG